MARVDHRTFRPNVRSNKLKAPSASGAGKHASGTTARVKLTGAPGGGLHVSVRNRQPVPAHLGPALPGSGAGLLGLQERVALAGGTLVHGPDGSGDFVVYAELKW